MTLFHTLALLTITLFIVSSANAASLDVNQLHKHTLNRYQICSAHYVTITQQGEVKRASSASSRFNRLISTIEHIARTHHIALKLSDIEYKVTSTNTSHTQSYFNAVYIIDNQKNAKQFVTLLNRKGYQTELRTSKQRKASCH